MKRREIKELKELWINFVDAGELRYNPRRCKFDHWGYTDKTRHMATVRVSYGDDWTNGSFSALVRVKDLFPSKAALEKAYRETVKAALKRNQETLERAKKRAAAIDTELKGHLTGITKAKRLEKNLAIMRAYNEAKGTPNEQA